MCSLLVEAKEITVAIPYIQLGRVELDPMGVPVAASMQRPHGERFEQLLRDTLTDGQDDVAGDLPAAPESEATAGLNEADLDDVDADARPTSRDADETPEGDASEGDTPALDEQADVTDSLRRNDPETAPRSERQRDGETKRPAAATHEPLLAAAFHAQRGAQQPLVAGPAMSPPNQPMPARAADALVRGAGGAPLASASHVKSAAVQTGYATKSAHSMQLLEQARDSVFKQILMKLTDGGGEMRMRLSPPDLGQLDLRMTVEGGNKLTLVIGAERGDMAQLLQRHLEELKSTLQENGLEVTGAEVQTRDDFERQQAADGDAGDDASHAADDFAEDAASAPRPRGYVTADGLDFWA